jgi:small-conductance mechanosensitive channel
MLAAASTSRVGGFQVPLGALINVAKGAAVFATFCLAAWLLWRLVTAALARRSVRPDAVHLVVRVISGVLVGLGAFMFTSIALGNAIYGLTGVLVAVFSASLGLQDLFKNYVSGFYVLLERNVRVGELVEVGGYRGVVSEIRMRVTYMRGADGALIVVPNSEFFTKTLTVAPAPEQRGDDDTANGTRS